MAMGNPVGQRAEGGRPGVLPQEGVGQGALQQPEPGLCPDAQNQEMQRESAAGRRPQWRKKPEPPLGPKVSGGPGAGAAVPGESGQLVPSPPCRPGLCPAWGAWGKGSVPGPPQEPLVLTTLGPTAGVRSQSQASSRAGRLSRPLSTLDPPRALNQPSAQAKRFQWAQEKQPIQEKEILTALFISSEGSETIAPMKQDWVYRKKNLQR